VRFGNIPQGLVFSTFRDHVPPVAATRGEVDVNIDPSVVPYKSSGSVKGAVTGFNVNLLNGNSYTPAQAVVTAEWSNILIYQDADISGLGNTFLRRTP
jgi:hypothetical protein